MKPHSKSILLMSSYLSLVAPPVLAQDAESVAPQIEDSGQLEEIIVTAQRKEQSLQEVPIAVNVLTSDRLANQGVADTTALQAVVPGLDFTQTGSGGAVYLRGIGTNSGTANTEPSVALYVDGVYIASLYANLMDFNNIERVEVLKGPQGTLFGRNSTGGVIQIVTRDPQHDTAVEAQLGYANYDTVSGSLYATGGITDNLAMDIAVQGEHQGDGWGRNVTLNVDAYRRESYSGRTKLRWEPTEDLTVRLSGDYSFFEGDVPAYRLTPGTRSVTGKASPPGKYDTSSNVVINGRGMPGSTTKAGGASLRIDYDLGGAQFVSLSSYRKANNLQAIDSDGIEDFFLSGFIPSKQRNVSQEFQLLSPSDSKIDWTIGTFLYRTVVSADAILGGIAAGPTRQRIIFGRQRTKSGSIYGQVTAELFANTKATAGLRFTAEEQNNLSKVNGVALPRPKPRSYDKFTWRLALNHDFTPRVHGYVSYNRGVKGGGFDALAPGTTGFDPETVDAYEVGLKSELFDRRVRFNASVFRNDFKNIQVSAVPNTTVVTTNAARARIQGVDADLEVSATRNLTIYATAGLLDGEYRSFTNAIFFPQGPNFGPSTFPRDATGFDTIRTPKFTCSVTLDYRVPTESGDYFLSATATHNSGYAISVDNDFRQPEYTLVNATVGWNAPDDAYGVKLWGKNLTKEYYYSSANKGGNGEAIVPAAPRTYGITLLTKF